MAGSSKEQKADALRDSAQALDSDMPALEPEFLDAMFSEVEATNSRNDAGFVGWLRTRPSWVRQLLLVSSGLMMASGIALVGVRPNFTQLPTAYVVASGIGLTLAMVATAVLALRPLHQRALGRAVDWGLAAVALLVMLAVTGFTPHVDGPSPPLAASVTHCALMGTAMALPVLLLARLLDRGSLAGPLMSALAAGLTANLMLMLRCPVDDPAHCVLGHFGVALLLIGLMAGLRRLA